MENMNFSLIVASSRFNEVAVKFSAIEARLAQAYK